MGGSKSRARWAIAGCVLLFALPDLAAAAPGKGKGSKAKESCAEVSRTYFQRLPPAPVWPSYEAMEIEFSEGKRGKCNMRLVVTQKETLELLTFRAVCSKGSSAYRCQGEGKTGAVWFQLAGRGKDRRMVLHLPEPGLTLTGLANRDLTDRIRTWRGAIVIELMLARDGQADHRS